MVDAVTNNYSLTLPLVGGDSGTWGTILNGNTFTPVDAILGATFTTTVTSADVTLTTTQFQNAVFVVSGTLTGSHSLIVPISPNLAGTACGGKFIVVNNGAGAFNLSVKTAATGSLGVNVPQGFAASLYSDSINVGYASNGLPGFATAVNGNPNSQLAGTAGSVNTNAQIAYDYTNGILYLCTTSGTSGSAVWSQPTFVVPRGFNAPINLSLTASVAANSLTITAVAASSGTTPTITNPIIFPFRSATLANGAPTTVNATGALSIQIYSAATLGAANGTPFRAWIVAFNAGGTAQLGVINCSNSNGVFGLDETGVASSHAMTVGATSTGIFYTPANTTATASAFRIIGFASYESGLVTAGTYNNPPTVMQLFGPGVKKPGDVVQRVFTTNSASTSTNSSTKVQTSTNATIIPTSAVNLIKAAVAGGVISAAGSSPVAAQISRGAVPTLIGNETGMAAVSGGSSVSLQAIDAPATTSSTTYFVYTWLPTGGSAGTWLGTSQSLVYSSVMTLAEIMG